MDTGESTRGQRIARRLVDDVGGRGQRLGERRHMACAVDKNVVASRNRVMESAMARARVVLLVMSAMVVSVAQLAEAAESDGRDFSDTLEQRLIACSACHGKQ